MEGEDQVGAAFGEAGAEGGAVDVGHVADRYAEAAAGLRERGVLDIRRRAARTHRAGQAGQREVEEQIRDEFRPGLAEPLDRLPDGAAGLRPERVRQADERDPARVGRDETPNRP